MLRRVEEELSGLSAHEALAKIATLFAGSVTFSTSFGWEDQLISHLIFFDDLPINVFTLDTGRIFTETYSVWNRTLERYKKRIEVFYPQQEAVQELLSEKGPNSFYQSLENRKECCHIRKVEPLGRALKGKQVWITGIRAEQSANRTGMSWLEWDESHQLIKFHPLFNWTLEQVKEAIKLNNIPYNSLHDKGFPSIGCLPCTRAVQPGEDFRSGRWWWEDADKKECGLHVAAAAKP